MTDLPPFSFYRLLIGTLVLAGTSVGAGMLAIPVATGGYGLAPALTTTFITWLFMTITGLMFLEVTLWMPKGANLTSMASRYLGKTGKVISIISFLFLYYCLEVSYISGGSQLIVASLKNFFGADIPPTAATLFFTGAIAAIAICGTAWAGQINLLLMACLVLTYGLVINSGFETINLANQSWGKWEHAYWAFPVLFSAFGYHNIIPTLCNYHKRQKNELRLAILLGTTLTLIIYILWQWIVIGSLTSSQIAQTAQMDIPISITLAQVIQHPQLPAFILIFSVCALITSFLGVSLSMLDFLSDMVGHKQTPKLRFILGLFTFVPSAFWALKYPNIFQSAIAIAGGIGESILNAAIPAMMLFVGTYFYAHKTTAAWIKNKTLVFAILLFSSFIFLLECYEIILDYMLH